MIAARSPDTAISLNGLTFEPPVFPSGTKPIAFLVAAPTMRTTWPTNSPGLTFRTAHFNIAAPQGQPLLADTARREDKKWPAGLAARHAHARNDANAQPVRLAKRASLVAQTGTCIRCVKTDAGEDLASLRAHGCRASVTRWKADQCLLNGGIHEGLVE